MAHGAGGRLVREVIVILGVIRPRSEAGQGRRPLLGPGAGLLEKLLEPELERLADGGDHVLGQAPGALKHVARAAPC